MDVGVDLDAKLALLLSDLDYLRHEQSMLNSTSELLNAQRNNLNGKIDALTSKIAQYKTMLTQIESKQLDNSNGGASASVTIGECLEDTDWSPDFASTSKQRCVDLDLGSPAPRPLNHCSECNYSTGYMTQMRMHMKTAHNIDRPYKCKHCGKAYKWSSNLTAHLTEHADVRKYRCHICNAAFKRSGYLSLHMRCHRDVKAFKCPYCVYCTAQGSSLNRHLRVVHNKTAATTANTVIASITSG